MYKLNIDINDENFDFYPLAKEILDTFILVLNNSRYRLLEIEFYINSPNVDDKFTYKNQQQKTNGKLFVHPSGVDITCGDGENYGGILIRSIAKLDAELNPIEHTKELLGPLNCCSEIFSNLNSLFEGKNNVIKLYKNESLNKPLHIFQSKRVGLNELKNDGKNNASESLRFIALLNDKNFKQKMKDKEKLMREDETMKSNEIKKAEILAMLGYKNMPKK